MKRKKKVLENPCGKCHKKEAQPLHTCPYSVEIGGDTHTGCDCCTDCEGNCAGDI